LYLPKLGYTTISLIPNLVLLIIIFLDMTDVILIANVVVVEVFSLAFVKITLRVMLKVLN